ncbi:hypothetical protein N015_03815 [Pseudomonas asturiensis]|uniref:Uncharacterized protein n=1 Tax=Pseudomonas asturiensis TaxID=1190415 RepID=A0ABX6H827_9PSED|nr:hypothetical protein [Pseudomonas asturiensis]QHF01589.1 hypothetical protein N015_03815 [Pseudomonas asturiensis]
MEHIYEGAVVNAGCLLFFPEQVAVDRPNDVLDSLLYIQLAAAKKYPKFVEFDNWKDTWLAATLRFGWALKASAYVSEALPTVDTVWRLASGALATSVPPQELARIETLVRQACLQPQDYPALDVLGRHAMHVQIAGPERSIDALAPDSPKSTTAVALQLGHVTADGALNLTQLHFTTRQPLTAGFLFDALEPGMMCGNVEVTVYSMRLMDQVYTPFREAFAAALQDRRAALVLSLEEVSHESGQ